MKLKAKEREAREGNRDEKIQRNRNRKQHYVQVDALDTLNTTQDIRTNYILPPIEETNTKIARNVRKRDAERGNKNNRNGGAVEDRRSAQEESAREDRANTRAKANQEESSGGGDSRGSVNGTGQIDGPRPTEGTTAGM
ncbi:hypothetical protein BD779DRAFT_1787603 [Infundibulicybe gibba]|nr:hypothetical protein BD779DRAFT_1787603 [Infundibulicybe gibba]